MYLVSMIQGEVATCVIPDLNKYIKNTLRYDKDT